MSDELYNTETAAAFLGKPPTTLRQWRYRGVGPAYIHIERSVRYRRSDLDAWLDANRVDPQAVSA
jgi:predicted DNA-binding transcriptional regulator AlpA